MNKRDIVLSLLDDQVETPYIPAGFFVHFDESCHRGQAAIDKHLEYFRFTGMDFVKIQYENRFPARPEISKPADWGNMPCYGYDFYQDQINIARGLVEAAGKEALVLMTLYSPFMCAGHTVGKALLAEHLRENPDQTRRGIGIVTESLMTFVKGCIDVGIDGFYHSTQGGETHRFEGSPIFETCIKPFDLALMQEIERSCQFNILHICDYEGSYKDLSPFLDYPGHVVNASLELGGEKLTPAYVADFFDRPFMGGLNRHGIIATGSQEEIKAAVNSNCQQSPGNFILGADCTLPSDIDWVNIKTAIDTSHNCQFPGR
jgi:uroporphyrinogen decarboxylase